MGNILAILGDPTGAHILEWLKTIPNNGLLLLHGVLGSEYLLPTSPESLAEVLTRQAYDFEKPSSLRRYVQHFSGGGLLFEEGLKHKERKKTVMMAFQQPHINKLKPMLSSKSQQLVECLRAACLATTDCVEQNVTVIDVTSWVSRMTLDAAGLFALDYDFRFLIQENEDIFASYKQITTRLNGLQFIRYSFLPSWLNQLLSSKSDTEVRFAAAYLRDAVSKIVHERFELARHDNKLQFGFLNQMILSGKFTPSECVDHVLFILSAGYVCFSLHINLHRLESDLICSSETTAITICWAIYNLAERPNLQSSLRDELYRSKMNTSHNDDTSYENLPLLNAVCNETPRLYPAVPMVVRKAIRETYTNGHLVPAGTYIALALAAINRSPHLWGPESEQFIPERWIVNTINGSKIDNSGGSGSTYSNLTFLQGPRGCTGKLFAKEEIRRTVAAFVENFELTSGQDAEPEIEGFSTAWPKGGISIGLIPLTR